jgi:hypothetical protein
MGIAVTNILLCSFEIAALHGALCEIEMRNVFDDERSVWTSLQVIVWLLLYRIQQEWNALGTFPFVNGTFSTIIGFIPFYCEGRRREH